MRRSAKRGQPRGAAPTLFFALIMMLATTACDDGGSSGPEEVDTEDTEEVDTSPRSIFFKESNNYSYESALHIPTVETAASPDIEICWGDLRLDMQCHEIDPLTDIDNVSLVRIGNLTEAEIETALGEGTLQQSNIAGYLEQNTDGENSCVSLSDFSFRGSEVTVEDEYVVSDTNKYLLVLTTGTEPGLGARMMTFLVPTESSTNTAVDIPEEGCEYLDFSADLTSLTPVDVPMDEAIILDWSNIAPGGITRAMLGFYEGMTAADLETKVLDLMMLADSKWEIPIESVGAVALTDLTDENGDPFEEFNSDGAWIFLLMCDSCQNPAPPFLTLLNPQGGE